MSINYQFGDVDAHGALIRAQAASLKSEHQAIVRDVLAAGDFWGGAGSVACQEFITQLGRTRWSPNKPTPTGKRYRPPAATWPAPTAPSAPAGPDRWIDRGLRPNGDALVRPRETGGSVAAGSSAKTRDVPRGLAQHSVWAGNR